LHLTFELTGSALLRSPVERRVGGVE